MIKIDIHTYTQYAYTVYDTYIYTHIEGDICKIIQE